MLDLDGFPFHLVSLPVRGPKFKRAQKHCNCEELEKILSETANLSDHKAIAEMFHATDTNGDGRITFLEFVNMMKE
ncbi:hypothetical protein Tcan_06323 [Toxocara canis]|uniref:EF-hand domain-containing protein n=1 Tax=Toxocara canis TaxID=6265 RepID=A0A0B2VCG3_TOXCA|nr:hypothetical protein Tcan_06323 [Toxocara canis]